MSARRSLLAFESARALSASLSAIGLAAFVLTTPIIIWLLSWNGAAARAPMAELSFLIGLLWSWMSAVSVADRNRASVVADIWWALEPSFQRQSVLIFLAWAPIGLVQGVIVLAAAAVVRGDSSIATSLLWCMAGFVAGVPGGVFLATLARIWAGAGLIAGLAFLAALAFADRLGAVAAETSVWVSVAAFASYAAASLVLHMLLSPHARGRN